MNATLAVLSLLFLKHFLADFVLQRPYHFLNKGKYGHFGGIEHAAIHALGTGLAVLVFVNPLLALELALLDLTIHYHVDWAKVQLNTRYQLKQENPKYWWLFGLDQLAHTMTYIGIAHLVSLYVG